MMAYNKIVYIYIDGFDLEADIFKQKQHHEEKWGNNPPFILVKYKGQGAFEYTQNNETHFGLPPIDENTKIIVMGHGVPKTHQLSQLATGGGIQLSVQTIVDAIKMPEGQRVQWALRGCNTGVGKSRDSHEDSFAGQLFAKLSAKGLKPSISASLSYTSVLNTGQLGRFTAMNNTSSYYDGMVRYYEKLAREIYQNSSRETRDAFEKFQLIQQLRRMAVDSKARGSKVVLTENQGSMESYYPYGYPNEIFDINKLGPAGRLYLTKLLGKEVLLAQNFKDKLEAVKEELGKIFVALEREMKHLNIGQTDQYIRLKKFFLEEDYYFDIKVIEKMVEKFVFNRDFSHQDQCFLFFIDQINSNAVLRNFEMDAKHISVVYDWDGENISDFDLAYAQFGLDIVLRRVDFPSPISPEQLQLLNASSRKALLIALGKQMMMPDYQLDEQLVEMCMAQIEQKAAELRAQAEKELYWESGMEILREMGMEKIYTQFLDAAIQQKFIIEMGKESQWQDCDEAFLAEHKNRMQAEIKQRGSDLLHQGGDCSPISLETFNFLETDIQEQLMFLIGLQNLAGTLPESMQLEMDSFILLAQGNEQLAASLQEKRASPLVPRYGFFLSIPSPNREDPKKEEGIYLHI